MKLIKLTKGKFAIVDDGLFDWLNQWKWSANRWKESYYAMRRDKEGHTIMMHREVLEHINHKKPQLVIHGNKDGLDNQFHNLKSCNQSQKSAHHRKTKKPKTSIYKGVCRKSDRRKWLATIKVDYKQIFLGHYGIEEAAARAYDKAAIRYFGEFAWTNFPEERNI